MLDITADVEEDATVEPIFWLTRMPSGGWERHR